MHSVANEWSHDIRSEGATAGLGQAKSHTPLVFACISKGSKMDHKLEGKSPPKQHQDRRPGLETAMIPRPETNGGRRVRPKLDGKVAIITGGDTGIGRAVAVAFAQEGANLAIIYLD